MSIEIKKAQLHNAKTILKIKCEARARLYFPQNSEKINFLNYCYSKLENDISKVKNSINNQNNFWYIAKINNRIVGYISGSYELGHINSLFINPNFQRMGIGKALLNIGLSILKDKKYISLNVTKENENAINFYKRNGFIISSKKVHSIRVFNKEFQRYNMLKTNY